MLILGLITIPSSTPLSILISFPTGLSAVRDGDDAPRDAHDGRDVLHDGGLGLEQECSRSPHLLLMHQPH